MACPRSDGSAGGRRKHRPPRSPDRLQASDRWLPTQATTCRVRRHPDLPVLPPPETPRTSPSSAGRKVSATGGREAASGPSRWRPRTADAIPAGGPPPDRPAESAPSALPCTAPWAPRPHRPHRPCRGTVGSRIDSVPSGRCPHSRIDGTGKSGSPESWHPSEGGFPL